MVGVLSVGRLLGSRVSIAALFGFGTDAGTLLGATETDGLAVDFTAATPDLLIRDAASTLNYSGTPFLNDGGKLTFSRTSLATVVDDDGLIKWAPHNLVLQSAAFNEAAWTKTRASVTATNIPAPDGTATADTLTEDTTASNSHTVTSANVTTASTTVHSYSVFLKAAGRSWAVLYLDAGGANTGAWFDLQNGAVGTRQVNNISATITAVGDGWYRCAITWATTATAIRVAIAIATADNSLNYTGDGTSGIYLWGAHLYRSDLGGMQDNGSAYPTYNATVAAAYYGPRIDHDPVTLAKRGLLMEEARTNLLTFSEQFDNAAWIESNISTIVAGTTVAPDGTATAETLTASAGSNIYGVYATGVTVTSAATYTVSFFVKKGTHRYVYVNITSTNDWIAAVYDLDGGGTAATQTAVGASSGTVSASSQIDYGGGWYRISLTGSSSGTSKAILVGFAAGATGQSFNTGGNISFNAAGTETFHVWGAQLEAGAFPTSYIPTTTASVTRAADACSIATSLFPYSATAGSAVGDITNAVSAAASFTISDGTTNERLLFYAAGTNLSLRVVDGGVIQAELASGVSTISTFKQGGAWAANDIAHCVNGGAVGADASATLPTVNKINIGSGHSGGNSVSGHIRQFTYLPRRITNAELIERTSA